MKQQTGINCLSLFDGLSCGQIALQRAGIQVNNYFASEIDKNAIKVTQSNFPNTIQLGDVTKIKIKSIYLEGADSSLGVNSIDDTNLQDIVPKWEMLYWLNKEFVISATIRAQKSNEKSKLQSSSVQCFEEVWFSKRGVGDIIKTRDIERCRESRDISDTREYSELQCGEWWYVYRGYSRNSPQNIRRIERKGSIGRNKREIETISHSAILFSGRETKSVSKNESADARSNLEGEILGGAKESGYSSQGSQTERDKKTKEFNPLQDFETELYSKNAINSFSKDNRVFLPIYPKTQITVVKYEFGIKIFKGVFQIVCAGSPCTSFSYAGNGKGFEGESGLFWEFARLLKEVQSYNPNVKFLLENVKMKGEFLDTISETLGVEPRFINSELLSAQKRQRFYWTNIPFEMPEDKGILLKDIIQNGVVDKDKSYCIDASYARNANPYSYIKKSRGTLVFDNIENLNRFRSYSREQLLSKEVISDPCWRKLTQRELEILQTLPPGYTSALAYNQAAHAIGNGWTVDVIAHIFKNLKFNE